MTQRTLLSLAVTALFASPLLAAEATPAGNAPARYNLDEVVVTAPRMREPLKVVNDPKAPQQPVPANDGASFLKNIPGFNVIRKGGTDGDPVLRGLAGSRLNVLIDGSELMGGCGMRMDPPTAYVFPETYDKVTVIKGPQTVRHGNGNLAGVVLFEREANALTRPGVHAAGSLMAGSWGRLDAVADLRAASDQAYVQASASYADADDYRDGAGERVHSFYTRKSVNAAAGWTPDRDTRVELSAVTSRAEAAYADRSMDGVKFDRDGFGIKFEKKNLTPLLERLEAQAYRNYIDHVMDNYSLRDKPASAMYMSNNPDRETQGMNLSADLALGENTLLTLGLSHQDNTHTLRTYSAMMKKDIDALDRDTDLKTRLSGLYGELRLDLDERRRVLGGLRLDRWDADRQATAYGGMNADADASLRSGFVRYEQDLAGLPATAFVGLGHAQRPMDYWEATTWGGLKPASQLDPEKNTQLDTGLIWNRGALSGSVSLFYSRINDYILTRATGMCSMAGACTSANVDATRWGGEADLAWRFAPAWTLRGSLAYVRGENTTQDEPLAQTPPAEARLGLDYRTGAWSFGGLLRLVAEQDRVHVGYGNIVGQDLGRTPGFATLALNAAWQPEKRVKVSFGVDNVFDREYAEHISRAGALIPGYEQTTRVNEPGRFAWVKLNLSLD